MTRRTLRIVGLLALLSALFYAVTGVPWWAPTDGAPDEGMRSFVLVAAHLAAVIGAGVSYIH